MSVDFDSFEAADCPLCQQQVPIVTDVAHGREYEADHQEYLGGYVSLLD
jgi:hypothetical protein